MTSRCLLLLSLFIGASALAMPAPRTAHADPGINEIALTADEQVDLDQWKRFVTGKLKSSDLRLRVLLSGGEMELRGKDYAWVENIPIESLVEQSRGSTDPLVLAVLMARCEMGAPKQPRCDMLGLARRWTMADTQNQVAWLTLAATLEHQGDSDGARATFIRAAQASMWHDHYGDAARVIARALPPELSPRARLHGLERARSIAAAFALPNAATSAVTTQCKDASMRDACLTILGTMSRDGDNLLTMMVAARLSERVGAPDATVSARRQRAYAVYWGALIGIDGSIWELSDPADIARAVDRTEQVIERGEVAVGQRNLAQAGIAEADAAARFVVAHPSYRPQ